MTHNEFAKKVLAYFNEKQNKGFQLTAEEQELMLEAERKIEAFVITSVSQSDIEGATNIKSSLPDNVMENIAKRMADDYLEQLFWMHLPVITDGVIERMNVEVEREETIEEN